MFPFVRDQSFTPVGKTLTSLTFGMEDLEGRQFLSASPFGRGGFDGGRNHLGYGENGSFAGPVNYVLFSAAPSAVQTGLTTLATNAGVTAPAADSNVTLGNFNGVETYTVTISGTGTTTKLTVDQAGNAVTAPTVTTSTFSALGTDNAAVAASITKIAAALSLTAPVDATVVTVKTTSAGVTTYSVKLDASSTSTSTDKAAHGSVITVDSDGNPVGNQNLPFSVIPTTVQDALNANLPTGATALATDSTQTVRVQTLDGVVLYSTTFDVSGVKTTVTVNAAGTLTSLPGTTTTTFDHLSTTVQTALQTLATANGVTDTIATTTSVDVYTEANGTTLYSVKLSTTDRTTDTVRMIRLTVDADGNPTTLPGGRGRGFGFGGRGGPGGGGDCFSSTPVSTTTGSTTTTTGSTSSGSTTSTLRLFSSLHR